MSGAIEVWGEPKVEITETIQTPVHIQERFVVRFAYGMNDAPAQRHTEAILREHPSYFTSYDEAKAWGASHVPEGIAFGVTKLYARLTQDELKELNEAEAKAAEVAAETGD